LYASAYRPAGKDALLAPAERRSRLYALPPPPDTPLPLIPMNCYASGCKRAPKGDPLQRGTGFGTHTYQWDAEGRMVSVDGVAGQACQSTWTACYVYNALGQRVEKRVGSVYREYMFDPAGQVIGTHDRTCVTQRLFRLNGRPIAIHRDSNTKSPHGNALGSTMFFTNH
jgi:YD repeat-containing protein